MADLTTSERFQHYIHLLRDTLWPGGELVSGTSSVRTEQQKEITKQQARSCIIQFFPGKFLIIIIVALKNIFKILSNCFSEVGIVLKSFGIRIILLVPTKVEVNTTLKNCHYSKSEENSYS